MTALEACAEGCLSVRGAADFLSLSEDEIRSAIKDGEMDVVRRGRRILLPKVSLVRWAAARYHAAEA